MRCLKRAWITEICAGRDRRFGTQNRRIRQRKRTRRDQRTVPGQIRKTIEIIKTSMGGNKNLWVNRKIDFIYADGRRASGGKCQRSWRKPLPRQGIFLPGSKKNMPQNAYINSALRHFFIGVTRFELATSASLRRRSSQTKPHPVEQNLL